MNLYECEMMFTASVGLKTINDLLSQCRLDEKLQIKDALTITVTQTLPEIPSDEYLKTVAKIIMEHYENREFNIVACRFSGYRNIRVITQKETEHEENHPE